MPIVIVGFSQIVLARELNLQQIVDIHYATDATIEFFIHGALCVADSGQCSYLSCPDQAQRQPWRLLSGLPIAVHPQRRYGSGGCLGKTLAVATRPIDAGVRSFKIEGRYKDMCYVKNITAHYWQMLNAIIDERGDLARASAGGT